MSEQGGDARTWSLSAAHALRVVRTIDGEIVEIFGADRCAALTVHVSSRGIEVKIEGVALTLLTAGDLTLDAERLRLRGRQAVEIESDGALRLQAPEQVIEATLGSVVLRASDDVALNGERVRLNCEDQLRSPRERAALGDGRAKSLVVQGGHDAPQADEDDHRAGAGRAHEHPRAAR